MAIALRRLARFVAGALLAACSSSEPSQLGAALPPEQPLGPIVTLRVEPCARSGTVYCWGSNNAGQLDDGTTQPSGTPVPVLSAVP